MTYYYKLFKRHSHFSMESITIPLDGPNELQFDQTIQLRTKIKRYGDLLSDMYFSFRVPDVYSKYVDPNTTIRSAQFQFQWVKYLGAALIQSAAFIVGGQKIQEFDGTYLMAKAMMEYDADTFAKWSRLVGETNELTNPPLGAYAGGTSKTGYPNVYIDTFRQSIGASQNNRPSIVGQDVHVPLNFWFTDATSQALPLVALQYQECEVQLTLNPIRDIYTILDASGYRVNPDWRIVSPTQSIQNNIPDYTAATDTSGQVRYFLTDIGFSPPALNTWFLNPRLQCTFVYLAEDEQRTFASRPLSYVLPEVTRVPYEGVFQRNTYDLDVHNPLTRMILVTRRSDWRYRNDFANFTNWYTYPFVPFRNTPNAAPYLIESFVSGLLIPNSQKDIVRSVRILADGNEIQETKPTDFFTKITPFRYATGDTKAELPFYSWALTTSKIQPSGSFNASRVRKLQAEVDVFSPPTQDAFGNPLPQGIAYTYELTFYIESLNFFTVASGSGGKKYMI